MTRFVQLINGVVANISLWEVAPPTEEGVFVEAPDGVDIGWSYINEVWTAPELTPEEIPQPTSSVLRIYAFRDRADPLFFKWQVALADGEEDADELKQAWLDEREAIKLECRD